MPGYFSARACSACWTSSARSGGPPRATYPRSKFSTSKIPGCSSRGPSTAAPLVSNTSPAESLMTPPTSSVRLLTSSPRAHPCFSLVYLVLCLDIATVFPPKAFLTRAYFHNIINLRPLRAHTRLVILMQWPRKGATIY